MSSTRILRPFAAATTLALGLALTACGGGGGGSSAPDDTSVETFCDAYNSIVDDLVDSIDPAAPAEPSGEQVVTALKAWAEKLADAGTPDDMSDEARDGFELLIETADDLDPADFESADFLDELDADFSADEQAASEAFTTYATDNCESPLDLPSDLPSDFPTDLPSDFPSDLPSDFPTDLPSDFPTELLTELPSDFPIE